MKKIKLNVGNLLSFYAREGVPSEIIEELLPIVTSPALTAVVLKETASIFVVGLEVEGVPSSVIVLPNEAKSLVVEKEESELELLVKRQAKLLAELNEVNSQIAKLSAKKFH